jgi:hypothetical protein
MTWKQKWAAMQSLQRCDVTMSRPDYCSVRIERCEMKTFGDPGLTAAVGYGATPALAVKQLWNVATAPNVVLVFNASSASERREYRWDGKMFAARRREKV